MQKLWAEFARVKDWLAHALVMDERFAKYSGGLFVKLFVNSCFVEWASPLRQAQDNPLAYPPIYDRFRVGKR